MKLLYTDRGHKIGDRGCPSLDPKDKQLCGPLGIIWSAGPGRLGIMQVIRGIEQKPFYCDIKHLRKWINLLQVPIDPLEQAEWANNHNRRMK